MEIDDSITTIKNTNVNKLVVLMPKEKKARRTVKPAYLAVKRAIDIIVSTIGIVCLIPLTIIIYIANKIAKDDGPLFFVQERIGKNGKIFKMYKYRSMVVGADEKLEEYLRENEEARKEYHINKKLKNDPRITRVGNFIRKTSLDEFPQFINIFKGEMTLVGPRPYLPREKEDMGEYYNDIILSKPGITRTLAGGAEDLILVFQIDADWINFIMKIKKYCWIL